MKVTQIYEMLNSIYEEVTGETGVVKEDLSNLIDVGKTMLSNDYRETYANSLINRIGRMVFVDRPYKGFAPDVLRESWEWGSIMSKSRTKDFTAKKNVAWDLTPGQSVDQFIYNPPTVSTTLYNEMTPWQIDCSFVRDQVEQSFTSVGEYDRFIGMLETQIRNSAVQYLDNLKMRVINGMIGRRIVKNIAVVDVLTGYNTAYSKSLTPGAAATDKDFLRYFAYQIMLYSDYLKPKDASYSELADGYTTFTPTEYLHTVILSQFAKGLDVFLQSDTYHDKFTDISKYDSIPFWQGHDAANHLSVSSNINVVLPGLSAGSNTVDRNYVIGCMFDRDACGIINEREDIETTYNKPGKYWNNFYQFETRLFGDPGENCVVFVLGDGTVPTISLDKSTATVAAAATTSLTATVTPVSADVTWTTSDSTIATVSAGTVTGVSAGTATITASVTNDNVTRTASCVVTVTAAT